MMFDQGKLTEMFIILFDDMLLVTRKKKGLSKKVKNYTFPIYTIYLPIAFLKLHLNYNYKTHKKLKKKSKSWGQFWI